MDEDKKELICETLWSREYRLGLRTICFESKFRMDRLEVPAASIRERWPYWSLAEMMDFANAFIQKPELTSEDHEILQFLMEAGPELVWATIAHMLPRYRDRAAAFDFLLQHLASGSPHGGNCYQALEKIGDPRAIPVLRQRYEDFRKRLAPFEQHGVNSELSDYQQCCRALWKLDGSPEYETALRDLLNHPDEYIRCRAHYFLFDPPPSDSDPRTRLK